MSQRRVLVIGAGLAGCALAESFSRRGWAVRILDDRPAPGGAVASLPLIAQHPALSPDFDLRSRFLLRAMAWHDALRAGPAQDLQPAFEVCGRWQPMPAERAARSAAHVPDGQAVAISRAAARAGLTGNTLKPERSDAAAEPAGHTDRASGRDGDTKASENASFVGLDTDGGIYFPRCAAVSPRRWWQQVLQRPGVILQSGVRVACIEAYRGPAAEVAADAGTAAGSGAADPARHVSPHESPRGSPAQDGAASAPDTQASAASGMGCWRALDAEGRLLAEAEVMVLACREQSFVLAGMGEAAHGRLRLSAAQVWTARADGGPPSEDPGRPALLPIDGGLGLALTRPGRFWLRSEERHRHWLESGQWDEALLARPASAESPHGEAAEGLDALREFLHRPECWHPSVIGDRLQLRDNLPMIGLVPDLPAIAAQADALARNDRLPIPRRAGLYLLTGLAGRGALYAALGAEMIAAEAAGEAAPVETPLARAVDPARFIKRSLQRAWSQRTQPKQAPAA